MPGLTREQRAERKAAAERAEAIKLSGLTEEQFSALSPEELAALIAKADENLPPDEPEDDGLIAMTDGRVTLRLHEGSVAEHKRLGWVIVA